MSSFFGKIRELFADSDGAFDSIGFHQSIAKKIQIHGKKQSYQYIPNHHDWWVFFFRLITEIFSYEFTISKLLLRNDNNKLSKTTIEKSQHFIQKKRLRLLKSISQQLQLK